MKNQKIVSILGVCIAILSAIASATGIFYTGGPGQYPYQSIRNETINIYGQGLYHHMSADVAIQGIAQDYVTLFIGIPLLLISLAMFRKGTLRARLLLAGVLNYFFLTYLFYMNMAMYNAFFIIYVLLVSTTFFAFALTLIGFNVETLPEHFSPGTPVKSIGGFLIFLAFSIALLWLQIIIAPLLDGTIIPKSVEHYTSLTVQGFDLSIFLPAAFLSGLLLMKKKPYGFLLAPVTLILLSILMTALVAKIIAMAQAGVNVIPAVFIIPTFNILAIAGAYMLFKNIKE
ncbi:MAG TPA: hypothetical protein VFG54_16710 [Prolixibacteraceae bacterium]|nr:hypothetical protein [Prolixibacteraceae bacterium]